ncbi:hypothetical protein [Rudaeicoccus suwonensis]|uniref:Uncharacterized protein n=1 Tax=Rudaeicoccus suwonensis TaxID=657409 RepID=A0A561EA10_9MICO|nr:hypothetical protein [Rudaeicoccus suwonensis]TWE12452.1 hypothetical protein BKA23_1260 [Rudaeicoccus suwonensis]
MQLLLLLTGNGHHWVDRHILDPGRLPLLLSLFAFIMTFLVTRTITRLIRAGKGPFHDRVSPDGVHVHHAVPGLVVLLVGAFSALACHDTHPWIDIAGLLVGIGASLLLDEFALILHLRDVYWSGEGRVSVELVALAAACLALLTIGLQPFHFPTDHDPQHRWIHLLLLAGLPVHVLAEIVVVAKGKYHVALIGAFAGPVAFFAALTLARPQSWWARRYGPERLARAEARSLRWDAKWGRLTANIADFVAGSHSTSDPGPGR